MTRWYQEKKQEHFYKKAKTEGYRARSAYKLKQIQKRFHVMKQGDTVVDLGAAPGGWSQIASEIVGKHGLVVGIDLQKITPLEDIVFLQGDITDKTSLTSLKRSIGDAGADIILSDMAPNISGNYSVDHARSIYLSQMAFDVAKQLLVEQGNFVCKIFQGELLQDFVSTVKNQFQSIKRYSPKASRKSSSELYLIGKTFKNE
ncbi:MAG: RlmE family RNA methyltransferase [Thermoplasmatota archaeon]